MSMTSYKVASPVMGPSLYAVDSTPKYPLGTEVQGVDPDLGSATFIYLKGVASNAEGQFVTYRDDFVAVRLAANAIGGVATSLSTATGSEYGWFQKRGKAVGKVSAAFADNGLVYATATAGEADDAAVAGDRVKGALGASAINSPATGFAYISFYSDPYMDDGATA